MKLFELGAQVTLPFDGEDPAQVACAWSGIAEAGDPAAGALRRLLGDTGGLKWIFNPVFQPIGVADDTEIPWEKCHRRWHPRTESLDVIGDMNRLRKLGGRILARGGEGWPEQLAALGDREPFVLWTVGDAPTDCLKQAAISMVGSRAATSYGSRISTAFAYELADRGITVISGGAYGIDAAAHRGALKAGSSACPTIAVLCGGLGNLYPRGNTELFKHITRNGLLISEVPPHWRPARWRFLERNRVIAALGEATIVVEASERSGAIATANRAVDLGREVGAVPGPVTSAASRGAHRLIQQGAALVTSSEDICQLIGHPSCRTDLPSSKPGGKDLNHMQRLVWDAFPLTLKATSAELSLAAGLAKEEVDLVLLELKIVGLVEKTAGTWIRQAL